MKQTVVFRLVCALALLAPGWAAGEDTNAFWSWAARPVLGWNSWDFYGTSINEDCAKTQVDYVAGHLHSHGWDLVTVDIQWYQPTATGFNYIKGAPLSMDEWGRLIPATNRFPSAAGGAGFKPLAEYVHSKGLKFGIHMMRGIPRQAVLHNVLILGTTNTAAQIANPSSTCPWNSDMYGVNMTKPGAQEYYDSIFALVASWGVDFVKIDDLSRPYHTAEIEAIRKAIDKTGRAIAFSTSPGSTPVAMGAHVMRHANQWRVSDDFWDNWKSLQEQFKRLHDWTPYRGAGHFPDADMLPLGKLNGGSPGALGRRTHFTPDEQYTLMSLWAIARSPLILGADLTQLDPFTLSLLTNDEVLAVDQSSLHNRELFRTNDLIAWVADAEGSADKYLALFNATSNSAAIPVDLFSVGFTSSCAVRSLWDGTNLGNFSGTFSPVISSHRGMLYRLSGPAMPVPWIVNAAGGSNSVSVAWEPVSGGKFSIKRAAFETGDYQTLATGLANCAYTDLTAQNDATYYFAVSVTIDGRESANSSAWPATPHRPPGMVGVNSSLAGAINTNSLISANTATNWNNSSPNTR